MVLYPLSSACGHLTAYCGCCGQTAFVVIGANKIHRYADHAAVPLAGLAEVASLAGVTRQRAWQHTQHPDFPQPVDRLAMGPVWRESDVQAFLDTPRKAGRRPKS